MLTFLIDPKKLKLIKRKRLETFITPFETTGDYLYIHAHKCIEKAVPFLFASRGFIVINSQKIWGKANKVQLIVDLDSFQVYYRCFFKNSFTNWIMINNNFLSSVLPKNDSPVNYLFTKKRMLNPNEESLFLSLYDSILSCFAKEKDSFSLRSVLEKDYHDASYYCNRSLISFVDDDSGVYIQDIWYNVLTAKKIEMGFACITDYLSEKTEPTKKEYIQIPFSTMKEFYESGNDIYSHSCTHSFFYEPFSTCKDIYRECAFSKRFLIDNGFFRGSNIIVYPGGLGKQRLLKRKMIKRHFMYGVDTTGGGINNNPIKPFHIHRLNLDTNSFVTIKAKIDEAFDNKSLLVFMSHAYELNKNKVEQIEKIFNVIDYARDKEICIMPLSRALTIKNYYYADVSNRNSFSFKVFLTELFCDIKTRFKHRRSIKHELF